MPRIKIEDLPEDRKLTEDEMRKIAGGTGRAPRTPPLGGQTIPTAPTAPQMPTAPGGILGPRVPVGGGPGGDRGASCEEIIA